MRVIALLTAYNEERFIASCLENLFRQGVQVYLVDNSSTDGTLAIAERYLGRGLIDIEDLPRDGTFSLRRILKREEELAGSLDGDWFMHIDADEVHVPTRSKTRLARALADVDAAGYNAVNFLEFTFIPTREAPDHDHPDFVRTMRSYYPFLPSFPHRLNAWKRQESVELASSGGHKVEFPGLRMYPESFFMRHYLFLSVEHAIRKFGNRRFDRSEVEAGWHGWRARLQPVPFELPPADELRTYVGDDRLDPSNPRSRHYLEDAWVTARR